MKAGWTLAPRPWSDVLEALRDVAELHGLRFQAAPKEGREEALHVRLMFPFEGAAELAAALSDYLTPQEAAQRLRKADDARTAKEYSCAFDVDWSARAPIAVSSSVEDNALAWPLIVSFAAEVARRLGGEPFED